MSTPTLVLVSAAAVDSAFVQGVRAGKGISMMQVHQASHELAFLLDFGRQLRHCQSARVIDLLDDALATPLLALVRSAGANVSWLGQHTAEAGLSRHRLLTAGMGDGCAGQRHRELPASDAGFTLAGKRRIVNEEEAGDKQPFKCRAELMSGMANLQEFGLYNWRGGDGSMWFAPVSEARGSECRKQAAPAKRILHKHGLDHVAGFIVAPRDMHDVIDVLCNRTDAEETRRADACFNELLDEFEKEGCAVYRLDARFQEHAARSCGPVKRDVEHAIKRALDPNNVLAPGRCGIDLDTCRKSWGEFRRIMPAAIAAGAP